MRWLLITSLTLIACTVATDPFTLVRVTGTVTQGGQPAPARIRLTVGQTTNGITTADGTFEISPVGGGAPESSCGFVSIQAELLAPDLQTVLAESTRQLSGCGDHVVDFAFP